MKKSGFLHRPSSATILKSVIGTHVFEIQLEPHEQEISIPKLIERIVNPAGRKITKSTTTLRELVYELVDDEKKTAARKKYRDEVEKSISDDISNGRLSVAKYGDREIILIPSLVQWTFGYGKNVKQSGIDGRESYAAAAKTEMLKEANSMIPEGQSATISVPKTPAAETAAAPSTEPAAEPPVKGVNTAQIVEAFDDLVNFGLGKAMTDRAVWTSDARVTSGTKGGKHKSLWNPVIMATALHERNKVPMPKLNQVFNTYKFLADWREDWNRFSAIY